MSIEISEKQQQKAQTPIPWYRDPAVYLGLATPIATVINQRYGLHLQPDELAAVISSMAVLVLGLFGKSAAHNAAAVRNNGS